MTFDENSICVLESIKTTAECDAYIEFLQFDERPRHKAEQAIAEMRIVGALYHLRDAPQGEPPEFWLALARFRDSAATRHKDDLDGIEKRIKEIEAYKETLCSGG